MAPADRTEPSAEEGYGHACSEEPAAEHAASEVPRALVRIAPEPPVVEASVRSADRSPTAPFLAHLIATFQGAPQTRLRRRVDPNRAVRVYGRMMQATPSTGRTVRESR